MSTLHDRAGTVARPGEPGYGEATQVFNLAAPPHPAAAVTVRTVDEVQVALSRAHEAGLAVRVHSTGYGSATARRMEDALLLRVQPSGSVEVDADSRLVRIPAGTQWGEVVTAAAEHGLAVPHGSSLVGAVGFLLGGGVSLYGRAAGLAANSARAIELVTADGRARRTTATTAPELFDALRGGGGGFGVVTAVEIEAFPAAGVFTGATYWPAGRAERLLSLWLRWTRTAPPDITTFLRVMNLPPVPEVPPVLTDGPVLCVGGAVLARTPDDLATAHRIADSLLGPLLAVAEPLVHSWRPAGPTAVLQTHMDPPEPCPIIGDHMLLGEIGDDGAAAFLEAVGHRSRTVLTNAELRQLGGAFARPAPGGGVLNHLSAEFAYTAGGVPFGPATPEAIREKCAQVRDALTPWDTGRTVPSLTENLEQFQRPLGPHEMAMADSVRARVDPDGLFRGDVAPNMTGRPGR